MSVERLERVMWRVRRKYPHGGKVLNSDLRRAIMMECGTDPKTYTNNRKALVLLKWIKRVNSSYVELTDVDLVGEGDI